MKRVINAACIGTALAAWALGAQANLCEKNRITERYRTEVKTMEAQMPAFPSGDYRGDTEYNAWILACNRDRDNRGKEIDREIDAKTGGRFAPNLPPVAIKGQYSFYGNSVGANLVTSLEYRYLLQRSNGEWQITLPIRFKFPDAVFAVDPRNNMPVPVVTGRVDIAKYLAVDLGLMSTDGKSGLECDPGRERFVTTPWGEKVQSAGYVGSPAQSTYDGPACRVEMRRKLPNGDTVLARYYDYWKGVIETAWTQPGLRMKVLVVDHDTISDSQMKSFERDDLIWTVRLSLNPDQRPRFRSGFGTLPHMYSGAYEDTIAHESGHELGLDDEYRENDKGGKNAWRDCDDPSRGGMGKTYLMCEAGAINNRFASDYWSVPYGLNDLDAVKAIYPWILTRRYVIGKAEQCFADGDCSLAEYCNTGSLGRNQCLPRKAENDRCSADHQCRVGAVCQGKPLGRCITEASVALGGQCTRNNQCETGNCSAQGRCQCANDADCGKGRYCRLGPLDIGANECTARKTEGESCSEDRQCAAPATCAGKPLGKCVVAASVPLGGSCARNAECTTGNCDNNGICQCDADSDCGIGGTCVKGTLGIGRNVCTSPATAVALGGACIRNAQCASGNCSSKGVCQCSQDGDCGGGQWCDAGLDTKANACRPKLGLGQVCGKLGELGTGHRCKSGSCKSKLPGTKLICK